MKYHIAFLWTFVEALAVKSCFGFVLPAAFNHGVPAPAGVSPFQNKDYQGRQLSLKRQRRSVANVQTMGLFGLGAPEIAIILLVGVVLVGPQQLGKSAGKMAGNLSSQLGDIEELKKIPEEFQKGVEEGESNSRARNAKQMESIPPEKKDD